MWIFKAVFAVALVLLTAKAQELEETEGKKINTNCERSELPSILAKIHYQKSGFVKILARYARLFFFISEEGRKNNFGKLRQHWAVAASQM